MILRRLGNKKKLAKKIQAYFPPHKIYIEPFFGAGGMFFNKPKAKYNIVNDLDSDVFNLFQVVMNQKEELEKAFYMMPIHSDLFKFYMKNNITEPIQRAVRFIFLSNFSFLGKMDCMKLGDGKGGKEMFHKNIDKTFDIINGVDFSNKKADSFIKSISYKDVKNTFIYCDPPYLGTIDNYSNSFTESDSLDLFTTLQETGCKWAMSEFDHPFILQQAKERNLNVIILGERQNLKNRRTEILVTNYKIRQQSLNFS